jgi:uncharacterized protein YeaO (DUF488 family)
MIQVKRVYEPPKASDGARFLVDQLWPRGLKKADVKVQGWTKAVAPSTQLRRWFGHDPAKWEESQQRYFAELENNRDAWQPLLEAARGGSITLVFGARDVEYNNAVALKSFLEKRLKSSRPRARHRLAVAG